LRWRKTVVAVTILMFVGSVAGFALVQQQFFPTSTRSELFFEMRLPEGTAIGVTDASAKRAEHLLAGDPDIVTYTTYVGQGSPRFWLGLNPVLPNPNFAQIVIVTRDLAARERVKARLEREIADGALPEARARVDRFLFGPPVGFPVPFRLIGPDPMKVRAIEGVRQVMAANARSSTRTSIGARQVKSIRRARPGSPRARPHAPGAPDAATPLSAILSRTSGRHQASTWSPRLCLRTPRLNRLPALTITRNGVATLRRSRSLTTNTRSRSCGGAIATWC
jgi:hypothetical protein